MHRGDEYKCSFSKLCVIRVIFLKYHTIVLLLYASAYYSQQIVCMQCDALGNPNNSQSIIEGYQLGTSLKPEATHHSQPFITVLLLR